MATIFTKIIQGEIPCYKVAEDDHFIAFLDINPLRKGHTLVVPKEEVDYLFALPEETLQRMLPFARRVARAIEAVVPCKRIALAVLGMEVPHAHMHLVPIEREGDLGFHGRHAQLTQEEFSALAKAISEKL